MSQYPIINSGGIYDAVNYVASGPGGLGQNFQGFSDYNTAYLTGNFRTPFTQANTAATLIPQNAQSTTYTLALTDAGKHIYSTSATAQTINLPNNGVVSWTTGTTIMLVIRGAGTMNVIPATGVTMYMANNSTAKTYAGVYSYGMATLLNVGANTWFINGAGVY